MSDTINRQDAIDAIVAWTVEDRPDIEMPTDLVDRVNALPSAERTGYWIVDTKTFIMLQEPRCSVCGDLAIGVPGIGRIPTNYCPNCGAKMKGVKMRGEEE